jgi:hypothetical protein
VKVTINGSAVDATIVSIDDKTGKATVKVDGETKERTVNLSEIVKQWQGFGVRRQSGAATALLIEV